MQHLLALVVHWMATRRCATAGRFSGQARLDNFLAKTSTYKGPPPTRDPDGTIAHLAVNEITLRSIIDARYTVMTILDGHIVPSDDLASEALSNVYLIA